MKMLVTREEIYQRTPINGNLDFDKVMPHILTAQDTHVQEVLGTKLYQKLVTDFNADTLAEPYTTLLNTWVKPMLIHFVASDFYLFHAYEIANGGIFRHQSENSFTPDMPDIDRLSEEQKKFAVFYRERLIDYLCWNNNLFPEYLETQDGQLYPSSKIINNQIVL